LTCATTGEVDDDSSSACWMLAALLSTLTWVAVPVTREGSIVVPPEVTCASRFSVLVVRFRCPAAAKLRLLLRFSVGALKLKVKCGVPKRLVDRSQGSTIVILVVA